jgi:predicted metal-binding membrane protein
MTSADAPARPPNVAGITAPPSMPLRDRVTLWGGLAAITVLSWIYLIRMPMTPGDLPAIAARWLSVLPQEAADLWLVFMMWTVMMVAMMLPSASPMIAMYARIAGQRQDSSRIAVWFFASAYLVVWTLFSVAATIAQWALQRAALLRGDLTAPPLIGAAILVIAGVFQLTPLKDACLSNCRSPLGFFMTEWRSGSGGAFRMGLKHGAFCVGCCWALMALLFVMGVMNLAWVAALTAFVLIEKATPYGRFVARSSGIAMLLVGGFLAYRR